MTEDAAIKWCQHHAAKVTFGSGGVLVSWERPTGPGSAYGPTFAQAVEYARNLVASVVSPALTRVEQLARELHAAQGPFSWDETSARTRDERLAVAAVLIRLVDGAL